MATGKEPMEDTRQERDESPFVVRAQTQWFHPSPTHEEALARLLFLVEYQRRFGLLVGDGGTGKSLVLKAFLGELEQCQVTVAYVDLYGLDGQEMLGELAFQLNSASIPGVSIAEAFRRIEDTLFAMHAMRQPCVLCFDHLERSGDECLTVLQRLVHRDRDTSCDTAFVVATRPAEASRIARLVEEQADLRVELEPLSFEETVWHVTGLLEKAGYDLPLFDLDALEVIHERSRGIPREINRLCDLALLATLSEDRDRVAVDTVQSACAEVPTVTQRDVSEFVWQFA